MQELPVALTIGLTACVGIVTSYVLKCYDSHVKVALEAASTCVTTLLSCVMYGPPNNLTKTETYLATIISLLCVYMFVKPSKP